MADTPEHIPYDPVAERLAQLVAERRVDGRYPPALDDELIAHHDRVVHRSPDAALASIADARYAVANMDPRPFSVPSVPPTSSKPGGAYLHKAVTPTVTRHLQEVVEQMNEFATTLHRHLTAITDALAALGVPRADLTSQLDAMEEHLARITRSVAAIPDSDSDG
ncbi:MAG: hypothetical protein AB7L13_18210 [Acidimicrobiia bacterium]